MARIKALRSQFCEDLGDYKKAHGLPLMMRRLGRSRTYVIDLIAGRKCPGVDVVQRVYNDLGFEVELTTTAKGKKSPKKIA